MAVSRNRKKHKVKAKQRKTKIDHARNTYKKFMMLRSAMIQQQLEKAQVDTSAANVTEEEKAMASEALAAVSDDNTAAA